MTIVKIKKQKTEQYVSQKENLDYKNCLEASQLDNEINCLEKIEINVNSLQKDHKEFIKSNKLVLKTQQRFKSERHNVFSEEINRTALISNDDKRIQ